MLDQVLGMPEQMAEAERIARRAGYGPRCSSRLVAVAGMGGSGIGAELVRGLLAQDSALTVVPCRDYCLPAAADRSSLCFVVSYSGNTEETLSAFEQARRRKCRIVAITSGGRLTEASARLGIPTVRVPAGLPPRAALGYLFVPLLVGLEKLGLCRSYRRDMAETVKLLCSRRRALHRQARLIAAGLCGCLPSVYSTSRLLDAVAERWRCQLNENAKVMCHTNVLPEHNHNEVVGMGKPAFLARRSVLVALLDATTHPRTRERLAHVLDITRGAFVNKVELEMRGGPDLARMFGLIMLGDLVSVELARLLRVDPMPVARIDELKRRMGRGKERQ